MLNKFVKILLIEDNPADARLIGEMFKDISKPKYDIIHAQNLQEGLKYLKSNDIDILILDLSLPDSNGLETFEKAHKYDPELPIVILSGLEDEELAITAVREGAQDYFVKGDINSRLLSRALNYAIERKNSEKQLIKSHDELVNLINAYTKELKKRGIGKIDGVEKRLEEKIKSLNKSEAVGGQKESSIKLSNERVPKTLWLKVSEDFKSPKDKLSVSEKDISVQSAESVDLESLVEIIKELGERGYFAEEHYVLNLDLSPKI
ncbi:MAG: response regulator [Methanobacterium sp.]